MKKEMTWTNKPNFVLLLVASMMLIMLLLALLADGTGDDGDSIQHFLIAKYAPTNPKLFFDHWGKPLFTLLAAPFAQFDFVGIKIFNVLCLGFSLLFSYKIAQKLPIARPWLVPIVYMSAPMTVTLTLSGLTEPLFAFWLSATILLFIHKKHVWAVVLISFLPMLRSEGLIVLCVVICYLLAARKWYLIPLLIVGQLIFGIVGAKSEGSILWVFTKIPYSGLDGSYGKGTWHHFITNMPDVVGYGLTIILFSGLLFAAIRLKKYLFSPQSALFSTEELWLIYGIFMAFFVAHSLFWVLGIFNSYGLMRVMLGVMPLIALICTQMLDGIITNISQKYPNMGSYTMGFVLVCLLGFLIQKIRPYDFQQNGNQLAINQMAAKYGSEWVKNKENAVFFYDAPQVAWKTGLTFRKGGKLDDTNNEHVMVYKFREGQAPLNSYLIWENHFAMIDGGVMLAKVKQNKLYSLVDKFEAKDPHYGYMSQVCLFKRDTTTKIPVKAIKTVFESSFEADKESVGHVTSPVFEGKYSVLVNRANAFSPFFTAPLASINEGKAANLRITLQANAKVRPSLEWENAKLVVTIEKDGKTSMWEGTEIQGLMNNTDKWEQVVIEASLPSVTSDEKLSIYVWNQNDFDLWIDNMKVELLEN